MSASAKLVLKENLVKSMLMSVSQIHASMVSALIRLEIMTVSVILAILVETVHRISITARLTVVYMEGLV